MANAVSWSGCGFMEIASFSKIPTSNTRVYVKTFDRYCKVFQMNFNILMIPLNFFILDKTIPVKDI